MIANDIKEAIGDVDFLQEIQVQGAYLNFFVKKELFIETMVTASMADDFGSLPKEMDRQSVSIILLQT